MNNSSFKLNLEGGKTLFQCLSFYHVSRRHLFSAINRQEIKFTNDRKEITLDDVLSNSVVEVYINENIDIVPFYQPIDIAYEDEHYLFVNKKRGQIIHGGNDSLVNIVAGYFKERNIKRKIRVNNRLDCDTEGLVIFSKDIIASSYIDYLIRERLVEKRYYALMYHRFKNKKGSFIVKIARDRHHSKKMRISRNGDEAITNYQVIKNGDISLVNIELITGKTHQIRVTFAHFNHPLLGDQLYGINDGRELMLQAYQLSFYNLFLKAKLNVIIPISNRLKENVESGKRK